MKHYYCEAKSKQLSITHKALHNLIFIYLFMFFSIVYLLTLIGNGAIICAVCWDQHLHTPMYILLGNFASAAPGPEMRGVVRAAKHNR